MSITNQQYFDMIDELNNVCENYNKEHKDYLFELNPVRTPRKFKGIELRYKWDNRDYKYDDRLYYYSIDFGDEVDWMTLMEIPARLEDSGDRLRTDPIFIQTLQELGDQAYAEGTIIRIVDVPDEAEYEIETDGFNNDTSIYYREDIFVKQYL